jgi:hypothetical protein
MRNSLALAVLGTVSLLLIGCFTPCRVTPDPDCDRTKTNHVCPDICAAEDEAEEDSPEMEDQEASLRPVDG